MAPLMNMFEAYRNFLAKPEKLITLVLVLRSISCSQPGKYFSGWPGGYDRIKWPP